MGKMFDIQGQPYLFLLFLMSKEVLINTELDCIGDLNFPALVGGDTISVTKGVVSRVEPTQYAHGAAQLIAIQIDAAIDPGNSGVPVIMGDKVAGVAF
jgi:hypothetical protein